MPTVLLLVAVLAAAGLVTVLLIAGSRATGRATGTGPGTRNRPWREGWRRLSGSGAEQAGALFAAADNAQAAPATEAAQATGEAEAAGPAQAAAARGPGLTEPPLPRPRFSQSPQSSHLAYPAPPSARPEVILPRPRRAVDDQDLGRNPRTR